MQTPEKYDLMQMLADIEDDEAAEAADLDQQSDIAQGVISELITAGVRKKPEAR